MKRFLVAMMTVGALSACTADTGPDSPPEVVAAKAFRESGPKSMTVLTMVNNRTGSGGHTAMLIKGSQTVIFDPAGSFRDEKVTESGDVLFGMTPGWVKSYKSSHARASHHVVSQEVPLSDAQAEQLLNLALSNGPVPGAYCANSTSNLLKQVAGFETVKETFYPVKFMEQIATIPGVKTTRLYEDDEGNVIDAARAAQLVKS